MKDEQHSSTAENTSKPTSAEAPATASGAPSIDKDNNRSKRAAKAVASGSRRTICLIINIVLPGVGTLLNGQIVAGIAQFLMFAIGVLLTIFGIGFLLMFIAWIWALISVANSKPTKVIVVHADSD